MAITQEKLDKAVEKAVKAETKRCVAAVKGADLGEATKPSKIIALAVAAIKAE